LIEINRLRKDGDILAMHRHMNVKIQKLKFFKIQVTLSITTISSITTQKTALQVTLRTTQVFLGYDVM